MTEYRDGENEGEIRSLVREIGRLQNELQEIQKKSQDSRERVFQISKRNFKILLGLFVFVLLLQPGFKLQSDDGYKKNLEIIRNKTIDEEVRRAFAGDGYSHSIMRCVAYEDYFNDVASPALVRWLEQDYGLSSLENHCHAEPIHEPITD